MSSLQEIFSFALNIAIGVVVSMKCILEKIYKGDKLVDKYGIPFEVQGKIKEDLIKIKKDTKNALDCLTLAASYGHIEAAFQAALVVSKLGTTASSESMNLPACQVRLTYLRYTSNTSRTFGD